MPDFSCLYKFYYTKLALLETPIWTKMDKYPPFGALINSNQVYGLYTVNTSSQEPQNVPNYLWIIFDQASFWQTCEAKK